MSEKTAFIGLGVMGYPMAGFLAKAGHEVTVYNRTTSKAEKWVKEYSGELAFSPAEAAKGADYIFTCVGNDDDLRSITLGDDGAFAGMSEGALFVDHTTASAEVACELGAMATSLNVGFMDGNLRDGIMIYIISLNSCSWCLYDAKRKICMNYHHV